MRVRAADIIIFLVAASLAALCAFRIYGGSGGRLEARVASASETWLYPLDKPTRIDVPGTLGATVVEIASGGVRVVSSPCANQFCVAHSGIAKNGEWIACLPNGVMVSIEGGKSESNEIDAAAW